MNGVKTILQSRAIITGLVGMVALALGRIGYEIDPAAFGDLVFNIVTGIVTITTALQMLFRAIANKRLIADDAAAINSGLKSIAQK